MFKELPVLTEKQSCVSSITAGLQLPVIPVSGPLMPSFGLYTHVHLLHIYIIKFILKYFCNNYFKIDDKNAAEKSHTEINQTQRLLQFSELLCS